MADYAGLGLEYRPGMVKRISPNEPVPIFLREWRKKQGLTQQQLADLLPVAEDVKPTGKDQISRWERNERGMTMDVQVALAQALKINPADLFRDPNAPSVDSKLDAVRKVFGRARADHLRSQIDALIDLELNQ